MIGLRIGELFSGYGGLGAGVQAVLGGEIAWHSEIDPGACKILAYRYPDLPNHGDIATIDWAQVGPVDVLSGGFPCQDVSLAGRRLGIRHDTRSGLWAHMAAAVDELRPGLVVVENVRGLLSAAAHHPAHSDVEPCPWCLGGPDELSLRALGAVLGDLSDLGYDAAWRLLSAADVGAPHGRARVFVVAWPAAGDAADVVGERGRAMGGEPVRDEGAPRGANRCAAENADGAAGGERWLAASEQAGGGWARSDAGGRGRAPHADTEGWSGTAGELWGPDAAVGGAADAGPGCGSGGWGRPHTVGGGAAPGGPSGEYQRPPATAESDRWGPYGAAVRRWEAVLGRPAPAPTEPNARGAHRLSPRFVEWLMGLFPGWVTDVPGLSRSDQLRALGNGVVPQQAAEGLRLLLFEVQRVRHD